VFVCIPDSEPFARLLSFVLFKRVLVIILEFLWVRAAHLLTLRLFYVCVHSDVMTLEIGDVIITGGWRIAEAVQGLLMLLLIRTLH
jgi:hypothetical protein